VVRATTLPDESIATKYGNAVSPKALAAEYLSSSAIVRIGHFSRASHADGG
jgi:hypothetical protein